MRFSNRFVSRLTRLASMTLMHHFPRLMLVACMVAGIAGGIPGSALAQDQAANALYADAANFQTNGAYDLAVTAWTSFLDRYPKHPLAAKASHYLGVCYLQKDPPNHAQAITAFERALQTKDFELREQSLSNQAYCLFASATSEDAVGGEPLSAAAKSSMQRSLQLHGSLIAEFPQSRYLDRAHFYCGEAHYALGDAAEAVESYSRMLRLESAAESSLRCDALYARGVALEELDRDSEAISSYSQLLDACTDSAWTSDVWLRIGDLRAAQQQFDKADEAFAKVLSAREDEATDEDRSYALFRRGYVLARSQKPQESLAAYESLVKQYPKSDYAEPALLAAGQSAYQAGKIDAAMMWFTRVLESVEDAPSATEAAHWLARIELAKAFPGASASTDAAERLAAAKRAGVIAQKRIDAGPSGPYAVAIRLDAAEAASLDPARLDDAMERFEAVVKSFPADPLAPRALYNAAYTALQMDLYSRVIQFANQYRDNYPNHPLQADMKFLDAEAKLLDGQAKRAAKAYQELLDAPESQTNPLRSAWVLRGATALAAANQPRATVALIAKEIGKIDQPRQQAEAWLLAGQARMSLGEPKLAAEAFAASRKADPNGARSGEAFLLAGQAQMLAGSADAAIGIWRELVAEQSDSRIADQARFQLGQHAADLGEYADAAKLYEVILENNRDASLVPRARYALGWTQMQQAEFDVAVETLSTFLKESPEHELVGQARLSRGICQRNRSQFAKAREDLQSFLATNPTGVNLGHALYELALLDQNDRRPAEAAKQLTRLITEVPDYPSRAKAIYELGWSLHESDQAEAAAKQFQTFIKEFPGDELVDEAAYYVGQSHYEAERWSDAAEALKVAAQSARDLELKEKSLYRLGWSLFKQDQFAGAEAVFVQQFSECQAGAMLLDAMMMVGETRFQQTQFETALRAYAKAREKLEADGDDAKSLRDPAERQIRELVLLHGGQSAAQLTRWDEAVDWYDELRQRFPATVFLPQVFYETGFAHQQAGREDQALKFYTQVADNYRTELAARARFMMGEIYFSKKAFDQAIPEFQRVMFGFGAEKAPVEIQNWQAKSGFEAGRCAELLMQGTRTDAAASKAKQYAIDFYDYVVSKHPQHELARQAGQRLEDLKAL